MDTIFEIINIGKEIAKKDRHKVVMDREREREKNEKVIRNEEIFSFHILSCTKESIFKL